MRISEEIRPASLNGKPMVPGKVRTLRAGAHVRRNWGRSTQGEALPAITKIGKQKCGGL